MFECKNCYLTTNAFFDYILREFFYIRVIDSFSSTPCSIWWFQVDHDGGGGCGSITRITSPSKHFYLYSNRFCCLMLSLFHPILLQFFSVASYPDAHGDAPLSAIRIIIIIVVLVSAASIKSPSHQPQPPHLYILALIVINQTSCPKK